MNHRLLECLPVFGLPHDFVSDNRSSLQSHVSRHDDHHCHNNLLQPNEEPSILNPSSAKLAARHALTYLASCAGLGTFRARCP